MKSGTLPGPCSPVIYHRLSAGGCGAPRGHPRSEPPESERGRGRRAGARALRTCRSGFPARAHFAALENKPLPRRGRRLLPYLANTGFFSSPSVRPGHETNKPPLFRTPAPPHHDLRCFRQAPAGGRRPSFLRATARVLLPDWPWVWGGPALGDREPRNSAVREAETARRCGGWGNNPSLSGMTLVRI